MALPSYAQFQQPFSIAVRLFAIGSASLYQQQQQQQQCASAARNLSARRTQHDRTPPLATKYPQLIAEASFWQF